MAVFPSSSLPPPLTESSASPTQIPHLYIIYTLICVPVYVISQLILVFRTLEDRCPIGDAFYAGGQVLFFAFSVTICDAIKIDGLFQLFRKLRKTSSQAFKESVG